MTVGNLLPSDRTVPCCRQFLSFSTLFLPFVLLQHLEIDPNMAGLNPYVLSAALCMVLEQETPSSDPGKLMYRGDEKLVFESTEAVQVVRL